MARIPGVDKDRVGSPIADVFAQQNQRWGATLEPYEIYAKRPTIFHAVLGMWDGLGSSGLLDPRLRVLVNRRVAAINGCVF